MIVKHLIDHLIVNSVTCGVVHNILTKEDKYPIGIAICENIMETQGHYHLTFDETYFVLDGQISLQIYDPANKKTSTQVLKENELCIIPKGVHHKVVDSSKQNRLCVISYPPFHADDEHPSDKI